MTIMVSDDERFLAGLVSAQTVGGLGGKGGRGGEGGPGGEGGEGILVNGRRCDDGSRGPKGRDGPAGEDGPLGAPGNPARVITVSSGDVFGSRVPQALLALLDFSRN